MGILEDILERNRTSAVPYNPPLTERGTAANATLYEDEARRTGVAVPAEGGAAVPETAPAGNMPTGVPSPVKPEKSTQAAPMGVPGDAEAITPLDGKLPVRPDLLSEEDYGYLQRMGYAPEAITEAYKPYDPASNQSYLDQLLSLTKKPEPPDAGRMQRNSTMAGIGDSLRLLGEMASAGHGAHISKREKDGYLMPQAYAKNEELLKRYDAQRQRYDDVLYNTRLKAFFDGLNRYDSTRKGIQGVLQDKQEMERKANADASNRAYKEAELARRMQSDERNYNLKAQDTASNMQYRQRMAANASERTRSAIAKDRAYIERGGKGKADDVVYIPANAADDRAVMLNGERVIATPMVPGAQDYYYKKALEGIASGELTRENAPGLFVQTGTKQGKDANFRPVTIPIYKPATDKKLLAA